MNKTSACILSLVMALATTLASAQQPGMRANVLIVESVEDFQKWLQQAMAATGSVDMYPPSLKEVPTGKRAHFPIVIGGLQPPAQGIVSFVADVEFFGPDGKSLGAAKQCCSFTITNRPDYRTVMLGPTISLQPEANNPKGTYTVKVSASDGSQVLEASETFQVVGAMDVPPTPATAPSPAAAPRLRMDVPARDPGGNVDKRDCLSLPTPTEVIKCTEGKK